MAARAVQGPHEQQPQAFPQRMAGQEPAQLGYDLAVAAAGQLGPDPQLGGVQAELGQPPGLGLDQHRRRDISQRAAVPQRERLGEQAGRSLRVPGGVNAAALAHHFLEHLGVGVSRAQPQQVARGAGDQQRTVGVAEQPAQAQHVDADQVARPRGRRIPPDLADQDVSGNSLTGVDQQGGQDRTPLRGPDSPPVLPGPDLEGPKQPKPHHDPGSLASGSLGIGRQSFSLNHGSIQT